MRKWRGKSARYDAFLDMRLAEQQGRRPIPLAQVTAFASPPIWRGEKRKQVINEVMDVLRDWRLSPFEREASVVNGLRSGLCAKGFDWTRSHGDVNRVVNSALHLLGFDRPSWDQGQREYTTPEENCNWCGVELTGEFPWRGPMRFCSEHCAKAAMTLRDFETTLTDSKTFAAAYNVIQRAKNPAVPCLHCGTPFRPVFGGGEFCSQKCNGEHHRTVPMRNCKACGTRFRPKNSAIFACSFKCASVGRRVYPDRTCQECGKSFRANHGKNQDHGKFCSRACHMASRGRVQIPKVCQCCGRDFVAKGGKAAYCGPICAQIVSKFRTGRPVALLSESVLDYLFTRQGIRITTGEGRPEELTPQRLDWFLMERGLRITAEVKVAA